MERDRGSTGRIETRWRRGVGERGRAERGGGAGVLNSENNWRIRWQPSLKGGRS